MKTKWAAALKSLLVPALLTALLIAGEVFKTNPEQVEVVYSQRMYPFIARSLNHLSGKLSFSAFEVVLSMAVGMLLLAAGLMGWGLLRKQWSWKAAGAGAVRIVSVLLGFVLLFNVLWGFNYYRLPLAKQLGIPMRQHTQAELEALCTDLIQEVNSLSKEVTRNAGGAMTASSDPAGLLGRTAQGFQAAGEQLPLFQGAYAAPKAVWSSTALSYAGIAGIYSPFTGEAHVNALLPAAMLPATAMHEVAHVHGYAREDEANFIAWLTCRLHPDREYQYSGALLGLIYSMNALHSADPEAYERLKAQYSNGVQADLKANRDFWAIYEGPVEKIQNQVNNRYLKVNGQADGVASYGRMVDLLLAVSCGDLNISE